MLKIYFGEMKNSIYNTEVYFKNTYEEDWITSPLAKEIIKNVDNSEVLSGYCIMSPVLGQIPPVQLSGGTKTLLLIMNDEERVFNASTCGDNCAKWLLKIAEEKDVLINLRHIMDFGNDGFEIMIENNKTVVKNMKELLPFASRFLREMEQI